MLTARFVVTTVAMAMPTLVAVVAAMTAMTVMAAMVVVIVVTVMEQRIESDEGGDRRHVVATVMRFGRCAGQRQYDQAACGDNAQLFYP